MTEPLEMGEPDAALLIAIQTLAFTLADMAVALDKAGGDALATLNALDHDAVARMKRFIAETGGRTDPIHIEAIRHLGRATAMAKERVIDSRGVGQ